MIVTAPVQPVKPVPNALLVQALRQIFVAQARTVLGHLTLDDIRNGKEPSLVVWNQAMTDTLKPLMLRDWQAGMINAARRIMPQLRRQGRVQTEYRFEIAPSKKAWGVHHYSAGQVKYKGAVEKAIGFNFDLHNPKVFDAVDAVTMQFVRETNETASMKLTEATAKLREGLKLGLQRGDAIRTLHGMVREIFTDPARAFRIATTESKRALEAGEMYSRKESGIIWGTRWLAAANACPECLKLNNEERPLGRPFWVNPKGGPYSVVQHPPLHPH